ncbi:MAG: tetratricopeptide repeat protein [Negativicutes bacterium]
MNANPSEDKFAEGNRLFQQGKYSEAIVAFTQCIATLPKGESGYGCFGRRASAKSNLKQYDEAMADANEGIARYLTATGKSYSYGHYVRGYVYMAKSEYDKAIKELQIALENVQEEDKNRIKYYYREMGRCYYAKELYDDARTFFQKAAEPDEQFVDAYWWMGAAFARQGKPDEAISAYEKLIQLATPTNRIVSAAKWRIINIKENTGTAKIKYERSNWNAVRNATYYKWLPNNWWAAYSLKEFDKIAPAPGADWLTSATSNVVTWMDSARGKGWIVKTRATEAKVGAIGIRVNMENSTAGLLIVREVHDWGIVASYIDMSNEPTSDFFLYTSLLGTDKGFTFRGYIWPEKIMK